MTSEEIQAAIESMDARTLRPTDFPDVYLMTREAEEMLRREIPVAPTGFQFETLCGIPFESHASLPELLERAAELQNAGKKVAVIYKESVT